VLVAGASTLADERWETTIEAMGTQITQGSCYGPRLSVMAPTDNLRVAVPHDEASYRFADTPMGPEDMPFRGAYEVTENGATSSAAPIVASLAALVRSLRPDLRTADVIAVLQESAADIGDPGPDPMTGHGRVDFLAALELAKTWQAKVE